MIDRSTLPLCMYPSRVVLVDDNILFLSAVEEDLKRRGLNCVAFSNPYEALEYLVLASKKKSDFESAIKQTEEKSQNEKISQFTVDLEVLYQQSQNPSRHDDISVVVIDYDMPEINGDQFACALMNNRIKKLMLTGKADHDLAIKLLNAKIIDAFIEKDPLQGAEKIYRRICALQMQYFDDITSNISQNLFGVGSIIREPVYQELIQSIMKNENMTEYYTISRNGDILFINAKGDQYRLIFANDGNYTDWLEAAEKAKAPQHIIDALTTRSKLVFPSLSDGQILSDQWEKIMHPVRHMRSFSGVLYYAFFKINNPVG